MGPAMVQRAAPERVMPQQVTPQRVVPQRVMPAPMPLTGQAPNARPNVVENTPAGHDDHRGHPNDPRRFGPYPGRFNNGTVYGYGFGYGLVYGDGYGAGVDDTDGVPVQDPSADNSDIGDMPTPCVPPPQPGAPQMIYPPNTVFCGPVTNSTYP